MSLDTPSRTRKHHRLIRPSGREEFTAAQSINIADPADQRYFQHLVRATKNNDLDPWQWYDKLGEVHYAISRAGRIAGYSRLFAEKQGPDGKWGEIQTGPAAEIVANIYSPFGGVRGLISRFFALMKVPGDSWLIRVRDDDGDYDGYHFLSVDEIDQASTESLAAKDGRPLRWVTLPGSNTDGERSVREVAAPDLLGRVWVPSNRWVDLPDSPLNALNDLCEVLHLSTLNLKAKLKSRFASAGIFFVPDKMRGAQVAGANGAAPKNIDDVLDYLIKAMSRNVSDFEDAIAYLPIIMSGPGEVGEQIRHIVMDREILETDITIRREVIDRILTGLDIQQQATQGDGESTHWSAWAVTDEELRLVAKPDVQNAVWSMTRLILHTQLLEQRMAPSEILTHRISFEMTEAASKTNQQEDARQLHDRGWLKGEKMGKVAGFPAEDVMEAEEYIRWVGTQAKDPYLMTWGMPEQSKIDWDKVVTTKPTGPVGAPGETPSKGPGVGDPGSPDDNDSDTPKTKRPA